MSHSPLSAEHTAGARETPVKSSELPGVSARPHAHVSEHERSVGLSGFSEYGGRAR